jgi:hypothetical protein
MSFHVFIAYQGFKETPIANDAWLAAARQCDELLVTECRNRHGKIYHTVALRANEREWLNLTPYGLVDAQDPSEELIVVMFKIAATLGAGVYSERLKRYLSPEDWVRRTRKYRQARDARREKNSKERRRRIFYWALLIVTSAVVGWFVAGP